MLVDGRMCRKDSLYSNVITVDHIVFQNCYCLEQVYMICAQIHAMHVQNPIHIHFPDDMLSPHCTTDPCRPLQLRFYSIQRGLRPKSVRFYERFCLNLRFNPRKADVSEPQRSPYGISPSEEDHVGTCKMLTVHLRVRNLNISLRAPQDISLEDFPNIQVNRYHDPGRFSIVEMCSYLGITSTSEWPIQVSRQSTYNATLAMDTKSACFDSRIHYNSITLIDERDLFSTPFSNLSESLQKICPEVVPPHCVTVAVLDTGILASHKEFLNKIVTIKNFVPNEANDLCYDVYGHGTSCAGIVLRTAPFVRLVICKVMSSQGHGRLTWAAEAIDWLLNDETGPKNYCPVDIISMSFGCNSFDSDLRRAVSEAVGRGKVVVAAASNDGRKELTNIAFPARFGDVICVGSCNNLGQPSSFTPTGREIDFLAPGEHILAPSSGLPEYQARSGTSEATPIVAGIAAMVISYAETTGGQTMRSTVCHTAVMREVLRKMAPMPGHHDEHMGYGNLDPWRLFKYGPDHFRQVVEEIVGPLPVVQPARRDAETQTDVSSC
ncbi:MBTPS1 [Branchiostoma lanceolatum]|uniref:MBTPS1 protein n=1 Tax=Branchiostoma lanceolatum TaxID=7740 RepID=A0A8J9YTQ6_BRALA|nr:MBTPS1 [Branchiostoma lanceolatum]